MSTAIEEAGREAAPGARGRGAAASLRPLFRPRAVAVVGASRDPARIGRRVLDALLPADFDGPDCPSRVAEEIAEVAELALNPVIPPAARPGAVASSTPACPEPRVVRAAPAAGGPREEGGAP